MNFESIKVNVIPTVRHEMVETKKNLPYFLTYGSIEKRSGLYGRGHHEGKTGECINQLALP